MNILCIALILCGISCVYAGGSTYERFKQQVTLFFNPIDNGDPAANSFRGRWFREAMQKGDMKTAWRVFYSDNNEQREYCARHLVSLESDKLVELINSTNDIAIKKWMLRIILIHAEQSLIDKVFGALKPSNDLLKNVARSADLVCMPKGFAYLLNKIDNNSDQEGAVEKGVWALFYGNKTECLDPLLHALEEGTFLNKDLEDIAIRKAFMSASE
jgi:hypothetical protein